MEKIAKMRCNIVDRDMDKKGWEYVTELLPKAYIWEISVEIEIDNMQRKRKKGKRWGIY